MNEELLEHVGPGWRQLAADFCDKVSNAGFVADEIASLEGALRVQWHTLQSVESAASKQESAVLLIMAAEKLARASRLVCEGCGELGELVLREDEYYGTQKKTLCSQCAYRWSASGFCQWSEITGRLDPLDRLIADADDGIDPDDDLDEGRREPPPVRPRPVAGGCAATP